MCHAPAEAAKWFPGGFGFRLIAIAGDLITAGSPECPERSFHHCRYGNEGQRCFSGQLRAGARGWSERGRLVSRPTSYRSLRHNYPV